jgi:hypothetical protein
MKADGTADRIFNFVRRWDRLFNDSNVTQPNIDRSLSVGRV